MRGSRRTVWTVALLVAFLPTLATAQSQLPPIPPPLLKLLRSKYFSIWDLKKSEPKKQSKSNPLKFSNKWFKENVQEKINITGQRSLGYHLQDVSGDSDAFNSLTNYGTGLQRFTDIGSMTIQGQQALGFLDFNIRLNDNRFQDPQQQQYLLNYKKGLWDLNYGTVQASLLQTNPFASFSRSLEGFAGGYKSGHLEVKAIRSQPRGSARTVVIEGNNSVGPYYLQGGRIIEGTVAVEVDGQPVRLGVDYILDSEIGTLTFLTRLIAPTSSIVVTYESFGFGQQSGQIFGAGASYDMGKAGKFSVSSIKQTTGTAGTGTRIEAFQGFGDPSTPYYLQFEPIPGSVEVRVDGIVQILGVAGTLIGDYYFDPQNPLIFYFRRFINNTSTVIVSYVPKPTQTIDGDRSVLGLDYRLPLDKKGKSFVQYSQALGELSSSTPTSGTARGVDSALSLGNFQVKGSLRDIPTGFVSVEQTGFNRNERALSYGLNYAAGKYRGELTANNSVVDTADPYSTTTSIIPSRVTNLTGKLGYATQTGGRWEATHVRTRSRTSSDTSLDTSTLTYGKRIGKLDSSYSLERQVGQGRTSNSTAGQISDVSINTIRNSLSYTAGKGWSVGGRLSRSAVKVDSTESTGLDYGVFASLKNDSPWQLGLDYSLSDSGALASLGGFLNGNSLGYGGNGFSGGGTTGLLSVGATSAKRFAITSNYQASERVSINGRIANTRSNGLSTSNTSNDSYGVSSTVQFGGNALLNLSFDRSLVNFIDSDAQSTSSSTFSAFFDASPKGPWSYRLGYSVSLSSGGTYGQDSIAFDGSVSHRINSKQRISGSLTSSRIRGYYPQDDFLLSFAYGYNLTRQLVLSGRYSSRDVRNLDPLSVGGAFRSGLFDLELTFDFSNR